MRRKPDTADVTDRFTGLAGDYAAHRPSYPDEAVTAILQGLVPPARVADIGCGTGISTRLLALHGARVLGVDPNEDMLREASRTPSPPDTLMDYRCAAAEDTGLMDGSVDVVVCAQSFHWFDAARALREFHRILVPRGRLALMWNVRDTTDPFTAVYSEIMDRAERAARSGGNLAWSEHAGDPLIGDLFDDAVKRTFPNQQRLDLPGLLGRARSASYFPRQDPFRRELERELDSAFSMHQSGGHVTLAYSTDVTLAQRA